MKPRFFPLLLGVALLNFLTALLAFFVLPPGERRTTIAVGLPLVSMLLLAVGRAMDRIGSSPSEEDSADLPTN